MNNITLHSLLLNMAVFEEVAESGSYSAAANNLQMTPSTVSKRITQLEERLGTKLIERTTRSMRLTSTGEQFLKHCQNMLKEANAAVEVASQVHETLAGSLSIGVPRGFANQVLKPIFSKFLHTYPDIQLQVIVTDNPFNLLRENIDCAIELTETPSEYVIAKPLKSVRLLLCATPAYLKANPHPIHHPYDLQHHDCIYLGESMTDNQWMFIKSDIKTYEDESDSLEGDTVTVQVRGRYAVNHTVMRLDGVLNDLGIGCLPDFIADKPLRNGEFVEVLPEWQLKSKYEGTAWLTYLPNKFQTLRLRTFIEFLKDNIDS